MGETYASVAAGANPTPRVVERKCDVCGRVGPGRRHLHGEWLCERHPKCTCARADCDTDAMRLAAGELHGGLYKGEEMFVADADGHLIHAFDRPCNQCGKPCNHDKEPQNPRPSPPKRLVCSGCGECMHDGSRTINVWWINNEPPAVGMDGTRNCHAGCIKCYTCGESASNDDRPAAKIRHDWAVTPVGIIHMPCELCAICGKVGRYKQKRVFWPCGADISRATCSVHYTCRDKHTRAEVTARKAGRVMPPLDAPWTRSKDE